MVLYSLRITMNFMGAPRFAQRFVRTGIALLLSACLACGGSSRPRTTPIPNDPAAAIASFLQAVNENNLVAMSELWGSGRGPAYTYMDAEELRQRLTIMRVYLEHEKYEIVPARPGSIIQIDVDKRTIAVRLTRKGCKPVVPFILMPYRDGWLVNSIDLEVAGNPARACPG